MFKKSLLLTTLFALNPFVLAEEQIIEEQTNAAEEEVNTWNISFTFKATSFTQENWDTAVEKITTTVNAASEENSDIDPIEATLSLLQDMFAFSTNEEEFTPADSDKSAVISFTMNKLNDENLTSWQNAQTIAQDIANELNSTGTIVLETLLPKLRELTEVINNSESLQGNIFIGFASDEEKAPTTEDVAAE